MPIQERILALATWAFIFGWYYAIVFAVAWWVVIYEQVSRESLFHKTIQVYPHLPYRGSASGW